MTTLDERREAEVAKYEALYAPGHMCRKASGTRIQYGVTPRHRVHRIRRALKEHLEQGCESVLDVGCGRGWMLNEADRIGFRSAIGVDVVENLCDGVRVRRAFAHELPFVDTSFDLVLCTDTLEHVLEDDVETVLAELVRVARNAVFLTISHRESEMDGMVLHVTIRPPEWWRSRMVQAFGTFWTARETFDEFKLATEVRAWRSG